MDADGEITFGDEDAVAWLKEEVKLRLGRECCGIGFDCDSPCAIGFFEFGGERAGFGDFSCVDFIAV